MTRALSSQRVGSYQWMTRTGQRLGNSTTRGLLVLELLIDTIDLGRIHEARSSTTNIPTTMVTDCYVGPPVHDR